MNAMKSNFDRVSVWVRLVYLVVISHDHFFTVNIFITPHTFAYFFRFCIVGHAARNFEKTNYHQQYKCMLAAEEEPECRSPEETTPG